MTKAKPQPQQEDLRKQILQILNENVNTFADMEGIGFSNDAFFEKYSTEAVNKLEALISTQRTQILNEMRWLVEEARVRNEDTETLCGGWHDFEPGDIELEMCDECQAIIGYKHDLLQAIEKLKEQV